MKNKNEAITLIVLIVSIIVLIILAGISIAMITRRKWNFIKSNNRKRATK